MIGVGCLAHILNNALKNSVEKLDFGEENLNIFLGIVHQYFQHKNADRISRIDRIRAQIDHSNTRNKLPTKSYSKTRWLSTGPAIEAIISQWHIFEVYFDEEVSGKHIDKFKKFFESPFSFPMLLTIRSIAEEFEEAICSIEGKEVDLITSIKIFFDLQQKILFYRDEIEKPSIVADIIKRWEENDQLTFELQLRELYDDIQSYMIKWSTWTDSLKLHLWATLETELNEDAVIMSVEAISESCQVNSDELKENIRSANTFINNSLESWAHLSTSKRWSNLLTSNLELNALEKVANFILTLPGNNNFVKVFQSFNYCNF